MKAALEGWDITAGTLTFKVSSVPLGAAIGETWELIQPRRGKRPLGCKCDPGEWEIPETIPPACDCYVGNGTQQCRTCAHDKECHEVKP